MMQLVLPYMENKEIVKVIFHHDITNFSTLINVTVSLSDTTTYFKVISLFFNKISFLYLNP